MKLKEEMDRVGDGFRRSLRGSIDTLATRLSTSSRRQSRNGDGGSERLHGSGIDVEIVREVRRQRAKSADRSRSGVRLEEATSGNVDDGRQTYDFKFPSTLMLTGLRDGAFSGEIPLDSASPAKSVIVRIRDYRLEFYVAGENAAADRPQFVGAVSLPIYVDPGSLMFSLNSSDMDGGSGGGGVHRLLVDGRMKGCGARVSDAASRRLSVSASDLCLLTSSPSGSRMTNLDQW